MLMKNYLRSMRVGKQLELVKLMLIISAIDFHFYMAPIPARTFVSCSSSLPFPLSPYQFFRKHDSIYRIVRTFVPAS